MDPRAATAGFTSTLEFGMSLSFRSNAVIDSWHETPPLMCALHNELSDLVVVLDNTRAAAETAALDPKSNSSELLTDLEKHLVEVFRVLQVVDLLVAELLAASDGKQRWRILSKTGRAAGFQDRLRDVRTTLYSCLLTHNMYEYLARYRSCQS
jgi:hypothetical protein